MNIKLNTTIKKDCTNLGNFVYKFDSGAQFEWTSPGQS